jgi:hypothetical protein
MLGLQTCRKSLHFDGSGSRQSLADQEFEALRDELLICRQFIFIWTYHS